MQYSDAWANEHQIGVVTNNKYTTAFVENCTVAMTGAANALPDIGCYAAQGPMPGFFLFLR